MTRNNKSMPQLVTVLTPFPYQIDRGAALDEAQAMMERHGIRHLIVTREGDIYSMISQRDLQHHFGLLSAEALAELTVGDLCAASVVCADIHDPVDKVLDAMARQHLGSVVVLKEGELAGIFTTTDACKHYASLLREQYSSVDLPDSIA